MTYQNFINTNVPANLAEVIAAIQINPNVTETTRRDLVSAINRTARMLVFFARRQAPRRGAALANRTFAAVALSWCPRNHSLRTEQSLEKFGPIGAFGPWLPSIQFRVHHSSLQAYHLRATVLAQY